MESMLTGSNVGVCLRTRGIGISTQNSVCRRICGDLVGKGCIGACDLDASADDQPTAMYFRDRVEIKNEFYSAVHVTMANRQLTLLHPLKDTHDRAMAYYRELGISRREERVMSLVVQGYSNADICDLLAISRSTLRTHLNRVYGALRGSGKEPRFLPAHRLMPPVSTPRDDLSGLLR